MYFKYCNIKDWLNKQKISIFPPQKGLEFPGGAGGFSKKKFSKKFKEMYDVLLEFPDGWGVLERNPVCGGGMDIFWNYTFY